MIDYYTAHMMLPHFIWVVEAGPLSLYLQGKCSAEIVIDPTSNPKEDVIMYMRVENSIIIKGTEHATGEALQEFSQYTHNLGEM